VTPDSRNQGPGRSSPEVRFPCRAGPYPGCPCSGVAVAAHAAVRDPQARDRLSWGSCSLERTTTGAPCRPGGPHYGPAQVGEGRQAFTGAVLRVLAPLDGSGCARGTHTPLAEPVVRRGAPTFRGLVPCRSRPWSRPSELSLLEEPYPLSRACASLRVRVRPPNDAARPSSSRPVSPPRQPFCRDVPEGSPDAWAGTVVPRSR